jgi:hypothetical protein
MIQIAPSPSNCSVRPNRGLSTRNDGSHSITPVDNPGSLSITYPALHSRGPPASIRHCQADHSRQSTIKTFAPVLKSP